MTITALKEKGADRQYTLSRVMGFFWIGMVIKYENFVIKFVFFETAIKTR